MGKIELIIEERVANIGNFIVGRLLPFHKRKMVGPFTFIDHFGPVELNKSQNMDVLPHPHIGISTLTYLLDGRITHKDSLGTVQDIEPGEVNWMTAGKGIVHSERTPMDLMNKKKSMHGLQIWIALPKDKEDIDPSFTHISKDDLPRWEENGNYFTLIAGESYGRKSPVPTYSRLFLLEINSYVTQKVSLKDYTYGEFAIYIIRGKINCEGQDLIQKMMVIFEKDSEVEIELHPGSRIFVLGGEPFEEKKYMDWNFVSSSLEKIKNAKIQWKEQKFPIVPGETGFTPLPE